MKLVRRVGLLSHIFQDLNEKDTVILDGGQGISTSSEGIAPRTSVDYQWLSYNKTYNKRIDPCITYTLFIVTTS